MYEDTGEMFDLIIDDGGHTHQQQFNTLLASIGYLKREGMYVIEDIHTSIKAKVISKGDKCINIIADSPLSFIYQVQHGIDRGDRNISIQNGILSKSDIDNIATKFSGIDVYKRAKLPYWCYKCGGEFFDLKTYICVGCGQYIMGVNDSMTAILFGR